MKNKKLTVLAASLAIVGVAGAGLTYAYFTDQDIVRNTVVMGNLGIDLEEPNFAGGEKGGTITNVLPNVVYPKNPTVTVTDGTGYIRVRVDFEGSDEKFTKSMLDELVGLLDINSGWTKVDVRGKNEYYFYYNTAVEAGNAVTVFDEVKIPEKWNKDIAGKTLVMNVTAEAIQAEGFTPTRDDEGNIVDWQYSDGTAITAENYVE